MTQPRITLIAAVAENGVIGRDLDMPWKLSTDLKRFKALTMGKPMIMGRKTFLSVGERPLPGRPHIIVSRNSDYRPEGVDVVSSLEAALSLAKEKAQALGVDEIFVAGGGEIYRQAMPFADQLSVTHVDVTLDGDTFFPPIDLAVFEKIDETPVPSGEKDNYPVRFTTYRRHVAA
ncbi:dihydrofolate reductase [Rhizobium sp. Leaf262]|uniref:dihydrofolate reductase n=1 Tax=Rhizobium sp. Leaf262 TaxID=1736312 RepID=UPI0007163A98|nr:dihydrofolate reductase [Rhizobium sp. Leaf262]KQO80271.1 diacylglycerol kinase [Rhizobium sp. Leaf262]